MCHSYKQTSSAPAIGMKSFYNWAASYARCYTMVNVRYFALSLQISEPKKYRAAQTSHWKSAALLTEAKCKRWGPRVVNFFVFLFHSFCEQTVSHEIAISTSHNLFILILSAQTLNISAVFNHKQVIMREGYSYPGGQESRPIRCKSPLLLWQRVILLNINRKRMFDKRFGFLCFEELFVLCANINNNKKKQVVS